MGKCVVLLAVLIAAVLVQEGDSWGRFRIRLPRIRLPRIRLPRIRLPRIRLPRIRLPRIRFPRIRLPRIRLPWSRLLRLLRVRVPKPPNCPAVDTKGLFKQFLCSPDGGVQNAGCNMICDALCGGFNVQNYQQLCPNGCEQLCKLPFKRELEDDELQTDARGEEDQFSAYDENKDAKISSEEMVKMAKMYSREVVDERSLGRLFVAGDLNHDGFLDKAEFSKVTADSDDEDLDEFLREMDDDSTDEEKREYLKGLEERIKKDEITEDDKKVIAQLQTAQDEESEEGEFIDGLEERVLNDKLTSDDELFLSKLEDEKREDQRELRARGA